MILVFIIAILVMLLPVWVVSYWSQDELNYVFTLLVHHAVHIPFILALLLTALTNGAMLVFDIAVWGLRVSGVF
jgi:hypothetical protein